MDNRIRPLHESQAVSRREFLRAAGVVGAGAVLLGACGSDDRKGSPSRTPDAVDPPPETTTIRLPKVDLTSLNEACVSLAEQFLPAEGFLDVQYVEVPSGSGETKQIAEGEVDIGLFIPSSPLVAADTGDQLVVLAGVTTAPGSSSATTGCSHCMTSEENEFTSSSGLRPTRFTLFGRCCLHTGASISNTGLNSLS